MYKILRMLLHAPMRIRATGVNKQESLVTPVSCKTSRGYRSVNSLSCYVVMLGLPSYVIYICKARILSGSLCEWAGNWYRCSTNRTNFTTRFSFFFPPFSFLQVCQCQVYWASFFVPLLKVSTNANVMWCFLALELRPRSIDALQKCEV